MPARRTAWLMSDIEFFGKKGGLIWKQENWSSESVDV